MKTSPNSLHGCRAYIEAHAALPKKDRMPLPVVTISRETGAGAFAVAELVAKRLNRVQRDEKSPPWTVFDRNLVEQVLQDHELPNTLKRFMPEDVTPYMTDAVEELLGLHPSAWTLVQHTTETILRLAQLGNVILVGRGSSFITAKMEQAVQVRLVAPLKVRARHVREFYGMEQQQALDFLHRTDRARSRYVRQYFNTAIEDPLHYTMVLNTGRLSFEAAAQLVVDSVISLVSESRVERHHTADQNR